MSKQRQRGPPLTPTLALYDSVGGEAGDVQGSLSQSIAQSFDVARPEHPRRRQMQPPRPYRYGEQPLLEDDAGDDRAPPPPVTLAR
eukprot:9471456-Pyramimonas_sp.AAC.1